MTNPLDYCPKKITHQLAIIIIIWVIYQLFISISFDINSNSNNIDSNISIRFSNENNIPHTIRHPIMNKIEYNPYPHIPKFKPRNTEFIHPNEKSKHCKYKGKVFVIGMMKTGTNTLRQALEQL
eukprot:448105_1